MKKFVLLFFCMFLMVRLFAQTNFRELNLAKALESANSEGKMVLVDCYTSWCGPCKIMASKILPLKEVGHGRHLTLHIIERWNVHLKQCFV